MSKPVDVLVYKQHWELLAWQDMWQMKTRIP